MAQDPVPRRAGGSATALGGFVVERHGLRRAPARWCSSRRSRNSRSRPRSSSSPPSTSCIEADKVGSVHREQDPAALRRAAPGARAERARRAVRRDLLHPAHADAQVGDHPPDEPRVRRAARRRARRRVVHHRVLPDRRLVERLRPGGDLARDLPRRGGLGHRDGRHRHAGEHGVHLHLPAPQDRRRPLARAELLLDVRRADHRRVHLRPRRHPARPHPHRAAQGDRSTRSRRGSSWQAARARTTGEPTNRPPARHDPLHQRHEELSAHRHGGPRRLAPRRRRASSSSSPGRAARARRRCCKMVYMEERPTRARCA